MKAAANSPSLMKATANGQSTSVVSLPSGKVPPENLMKLRAEFRNKLQLYDEEIFMLREHNDWLKDMHDSMQKNGFTDFSKYFIVSYANMLLLTFVDRDK
uniref:Protein CASP n=1 Tax=Ascaris lumbricoides TaxID=6252 RepID=A0A0M3I479_ASCLU